MISEDFAFFGFDETSWERLVSLFLGESGEEGSRGVLVEVGDAERTPIASFHTATGSLDPRPSMVMRLGSISCRSTR